MYGLKKKVKIKEIESPLDNPLSVSDWDYIWNGLVIIEIKTVLYYLVQNKFLNSIQIEFYAYTFIKIVILRL